MPKFCQLITSFSVVACNIVILLIVLIIC